MMRMRDGWLAACSGTPRFAENTVVLMNEQ